MKPLGFSPSSSKWSGGQVLLRDELHRVLFTIKRTQDHITQISLVSQPERIFWKSMKPMGAAMAYLHNNAHPHLSGAPCISSPGTSLPEDFWSYLATSDPSFHPRLCIHILPTLCISRVVVWLKLTYSATHSCQCFSHGPWRQKLELHL